jgi:2'-5' RNA ligase
MTHGSTARLFVAVDPPEDVCRRLTEWARSAARAGDGRTRANVSLRVLDQELLHVTLYFLGGRPVGEIGSLAERLAGCEGASGELSLGAPLWLPTRRPRALAVELHDEDGRLGLLHREVVDAMAGTDAVQAGERPHAATRDKPHPRFRPHVTVARMGRASVRYERVLPPTPTLSFVARELVLYRSWLAPDGARYEAIATHRIG